MTKKRKTEIYKVIDVNNGTMVRDIIGETIFQKNIELETLLNRMNRKGFIFMNIYESNFIFIKKENKDEKK